MGSLSGSGTATCRIIRGSPSRRPTAGPNLPSAILRRTARSVAWRVQETRRCRATFSPKQAGAIVRTLPACPQRCPRRCPVLVDTLAVRSPASKIAEASAPSAMALCAAPDNSFWVGRLQRRQKHTQKRWHSGSSSSKKACVSKLQLILVACIACTMHVCCENSLSFGWRHAWEVARIRCNLGVRACRGQSR